MPLEPKTLGAALAEPLPLHSALCRREAPAFQRAHASPATTWSWPAPRRSACSPSWPRRPPARRPSPIRFVNIRETGGWSRDARSAMPKIAALLAAAHLPEPDPVATVSYSEPGPAADRRPAGRRPSRRRGAGGRHAGRDASSRRARARHGRRAGTPLSGDGRAHRFAHRLARRLPARAGRATTRSTSTCARAAMPAWSRVPEQAIGLDYQIDDAKCTSHRDCERACSVAGAIRFDRRAGVAGCAPSTWCSTSAPRR